MPLVLTSSSPHSPFPSGILKSSDISKKKERNKYNLRLTQVEEQEKASTDILSGYPLQLG
jgi:hypothetical protein